MTRDKLTFGVLTAVFSVVLTGGALQVVDPVYILGGQKCSTAYGVYSCAGYAPAGMVVIVPTSIMLAAVVTGVIARHRYIEREESAS
jgi:hypothetical protein